MKRRFTFGYRKSVGFYRKHPDLFPRTESLATILALTGVALLLVLGRFDLVGCVALVAFIAAIVKAASQARGIIPMHFAPGLAAIRLCGGASYHVGVISGLISRVFRGIGDASRAKREKVSG